MNAPLFWHFFCFCSFLIIKTKLSTNPAHDSGSMVPWSMFCPHPNNLGNYNVDLVQAESSRRMWEREDHYTVFHYFFQSKRNVKIYLWDVIIQTISRAIFNSIFYCSYSRNYLILTSNSLPADVLWGSFVTHSFSPTVPLPHGPWGRNECVTNEPQRTSAGALDEQERFSHFHTQTPC